MSEFQYRNGELFIDQLVKFRFRHARVLSKYAEFNDKGCSRAVLAAAIISPFFTPTG